jgi:hypothetical protein
MAGADWSLPTVATNDLDYVDDANQRDVDAATMFVDTPSNQPTGSIRWNRSSLKFQEWSGVAWVDLVLAIAGGGTGAATAAAARTALGLGSMATQSNSAVNITGGSIAGVTMDASVITSGTVALNRGGTGASLALGATGTFLQSNGASVVFGLLTNANVDVAAAIAWSKISKAGSSLADLATRSASDLSSGTLPLARLVGITVTQMASAAISQFTNDSGYLTSASSLNATNLGSGSVAQARLGSVFGAWANPSVFDTPITASTDLIVCVTVGNSGAASITVNGINFFCGGNGVGGGNSVPVRNGDSYTVNVNGGSPVTDVDYRTLAVGN